MSALTAVYSRLDGFLHVLLKFGTVGALAFLVDLGLFNLLRYAVFTDSDKPLTAKTISVVVATVVAYLGNRHWTFSDRGRHGIGRETLLFFFFNGAALGIALACLGISHYVLGLTGPLADNVSANVIGLGLGTAFRFWSYSRWVFPEGAAPVAAPVTAPVVTPAPARPISVPAYARTSIAVPASVGATSIDALPALLREREASVATSSAA